MQEYYVQSVLGQWNAEPGRTFCDSCLRGTDTENQTGYTKCVGCPPGRVTNKIGTGKCRLCSANPPQYQDISGQFFCKACMPGRAASDERTACTESGRNVNIRQTVTHVESYPFPRKHRLQTILSWTIPQEQWMSRGGCISPCSNTSSICI